MDPRRRLGDVQVLPTALKKRFLVSNHLLEKLKQRAGGIRRHTDSKGIPAERIEARGYGETKPIADNKTAAGQALNRRVDFDPYLTGEANSAEVKYGPAPTVSKLQKAGKKKVPAKKALTKRK